MKTNYEKKVDEIKNKPTLLLHRDDGGLVSMDGVVSTRQLIPFREVVSTVFEAIGIAVGVAVDVFTNILMPAFTYVVDWVKTNWPAIQAVIAAVMEQVHSKAFKAFCQSGGK